MPENKETFKSFMNKILNGTAIAIVVALIPNAILATLLKPVATNATVAQFIHVIVVFQYLTPIMAGFLIAKEFKFSGMHQLAVAGAAYVGAGGWTTTTSVVKGVATTSYSFKGIGDIINMMITAALAVLAVKYLGNLVPSLNIIFVPIVIGTGVGFVGLELLPFVSKITTLIGEGINTFTHLQPFLMSVLIAMAFAILIVTPISTVAISLAIGLNGLTAGASAMGVASTALVLVIATAKVNKPGVPLAIFLGGMKMMMPNFFRHPVMAIPLLVTAAVSSLSVPIFHLVGTPASAGFGIAGAIGPIASYAGGASLAIVVIAWLVVPVVVGFVAHFICKNVLKLYTDDIFKLGD
ncbi:MAG: PTS sugar transporter subunit IIC [Limosilactobacillus sp.]|uniref:PTS sugar transporter subunit IIC n=1 Tax=Limosilactobacillus sp. TaxID=2773925 RepID=UPI0026F923F1|nr:PTS sugar transporter subunit IIC [Limosilactobacillus sp.]